MTTITFRGGESTGGVADRKTETAKQETTGGVGARINQDSIFTIDNELKQVTVCFKANPEKKNNKSTFKTILGITATAALLVGGMGLAHKHDIVSKIGNEKVKNFFRHTDVVTEPCHKACTWIKKNCYERIVNLFNK